MRYYLGLGSNIGNREDYLKRALDLIGDVDGITVTAVSGIYETEPVGGPEQRDYCNAVAAIETGMPPRRVLETILRIEHSLGRNRDTRWGPRTIDIDILMAGDIVLSEEGLDIPHPRYRERAFVLVPFAEIAAGERDPETGMTIGEIACGVDASGVRKSGMFTGYSEEHRENNGDRI